MVCRCRAWTVAGVGSGSARGPSAGDSGSLAGRCVQCRILYPAAGSSLCSYCLLRAVDPEALGPADVEESEVPRDRVKEEQNARKIVEFALGLVWVVLSFGVFVLVYGVGPEFSSVSSTVDQLFQGFIVCGALALLFLVGPVTRRMLRWLERDDSPADQAFRDVPPE